MKRDVASSHNPLKHSGGHAGMPMDMLVERRAKPMLERDCTEPGTGLSDNAAACQARMSACKASGRHDAQATAASKDGDRGSLYPKSAVAGQESDPSLGGSHHQIRMNIGPMHTLPGQRHTSGGRPAAAGWGEGVVQAAGSRRKSRMSCDDDTPSPVAAAIS